jgi:hypothetical protein
VKEKGQNKPCSQIYQWAGGFTFGYGGIAFRGNGIDFGGGGGGAKVRYEREKLRRVTEWVRVRVSGNPR